MASMDGAPGLAPRRDRRWLRLALIFVAAVVLMDALLGDRGLAAVMQARRDHRQAIGELTRLRKENAALREHTRRLTEDPGAIETVAREELGLIRPGEILVVVRQPR